MLFRLGEGIFSLWSWNFSQPNDAILWQCMVVMLLNVAKVNVKFFWQLHTLMALEWLRHLIFLVIMLIQYLALPIPVTQSHVWQCQQCQYLSVTGKVWLICYIFLHVYHDSVRSTPSYRPVFQPVIVYSLHTCMWRVKSVCLISA